MGNLCDQLFQRSKLFRSLTAERFTDFLELGLGYKPTRPLPGPPAVAALLRQRALEVIEAWNDKFGSSYKQVRQAHGGTFLVELSGSHMQQSIGVAVGLGQCAV